MKIRALKIRHHRAASAGPAATPRIGLRRLERAATILEEAHKRYSKLQKGAEIIDAPKINDYVEQYNQSLLANDCGTPACALGHYGFNTPKRWGYSYSLEEDPNCPGTFLAYGVLRPAEYFRKTLEDPVTGKFLTLVFSQAAHEFGLTAAETLELFDADGCGNAQTAKDAAKYIRQFVKKKRRQLGLKKPASRAAIL